MSLKYKVQGAFERCDDEELKEMAAFIMSHYHYRDGKKYNDGSVGTIKISPTELLDLIVGLTEPERGEEEEGNEGIN